MNRAVYPITTTTSGISVFDRDNQYRPLQWMDASKEIAWLDREDNGLLLTILENLPPLAQNELNNPVINWTEDTRTEVSTTLSAVLTSSGTTISLTDPYICLVGTKLVSPADGEIMKVTAVNYSAKTCTITRAQDGTAGVAKVAGDYVLAMPAQMAELSDPIEGVSRLPTTAMYNYISYVSKSFRVGRIQDNSMMYDNWGQVPKAMIDTVLDLRRELCNGLLFQARATEATADEGQRFISQGALHYNKSGFLDLGTDITKLTWDVLNPYFVDRFAPDASSQEKTLLAGDNLFSALLKIMRALGRVEAEAPYFEPTLKTLTFDVKTDEGNVVHVLRDKYGLAANKGLAAWGFLFDMAHVYTAHYKGLNFQWFQNIQDNRSIGVREDAYVGSYSLILKHEAVHGVIRGGTDRIVQR